LIQSYARKQQDAQGGKDMSDADVERAKVFLMDTDKKGGGHVKKYTGGKSGDKYYGGGPVYPRPTKGN